MDFMNFMDFKLDEFIRHYFIMIFKCPQGQKVYKNWLILANS